MRNIAAKFIAVSICGAVGIGSCVSVSQAEDLNTIFAKVNEFVAAKNYTKAMQELTWAKKELEKMHQGRVSELLPASAGGFTGGETQYQAALGFTSVERVYKNGSQEIKVSIAGGAGSDAMGGFAGLAKMGMMMGAQSGVEQFRIDGVTASLNTQSSNPELSVFLDGGSVITMNAQNEVDAATLRKFAEGFKFSEIDSYLRGI